MFNSALIYELAVLKPYAEAILFGIPKDCTGVYQRQSVCLSFWIISLESAVKTSPKNSLMREFVGGSVFNV